METTREICHVCRTFLGPVPLHAKIIRCMCCNATLVRTANGYRAWYSTGFGRDPSSNMTNTIRDAGARYRYNDGPSGGGYYGPPPIQTLPAVSSALIFGRKRAVLCGVSYYSHGDKRLESSANDVMNMKNFLVQRMGFHHASVLVLTEKETDRTRLPTRYNIQRAMSWLAQGCQPGDSLVFHYSGHGSRVHDRDGDELDGFDEALCPMDYKTAGKILDDEINATIVRPLPQGATLHAVIDTCYSGTLLDLPYVLKFNKKMNSYGWEDHTTHGAYKGTGGGLAISLSASDDHQMSGDTTIFTGNATSVMTYSFIHALTREPEMTYGRLVDATRNIIHEALKAAGQLRSMPSLSSQSQEPLLSSSEKFNIFSRPVTL